MKFTAIKIAALFSYCGGPLFISNLLKPRFGVGLTFSITFLPVCLMLLGALFLEDDLRSRGARLVVQAGLLGLYLALGMHAYAIWCFAHGVGVVEQRLYYIGIVIGVVWSAAYLWEARRWARPRGEARAVDRDPTEPIEPS